MRISLERIKTKAGKKWSQTRALRLVRIVGEGLYWRSHRSGYTKIEDRAGIYTFEDALNASAHCSEESRIVYDFLKVGDGVVTQEPSGKAWLLLSAV